jgi:hypothetical protein
MIRFSSKAGRTPDSSLTTEGSFQKPVGDAMNIGMLPILTDDAAYERDVQRGSLRLLDSR